MARVVHRVAEPEAAAAAAVPAVLIIPPTVVLFVVLVSLLSAVAIRRGGGRARSGFRVCLELFVSIIDIDILSEG